MNGVDYGIILELLKVFNKYGLSTETVFDVCKVAIKLYDVSEAMSRYELAGDDDLLEFINSLSEGEFRELYGIVSWWKLD